MNGRFVHINGRIVTVEEAKVSVFDRGVLYGDGLYETIRVRNGRCLRFDPHMDRLTRGLAVLDIPMPNIDLHVAIQKIMEANGLVDARVRVTITRGEMADARRPTVIVTAVPLPEHGLDLTKVVISTYRRDETSPLVKVKTLNCLTSVMASIDAHKAGKDDAIMLNTRGCIAEATTANVFMVSGKWLMTPPLDQGCLAGTVRSAVLELAPKLGLEVVEAEIRPDELLAADELFLTSAIRLARPISEVDGNGIGAGTYEVCARVREALLKGEL